MRICKWCGVELRLWRRILHTTFCERCEFASSAPCSEMADLGKQEIKATFHL